MLLQDVQHQGIGVVQGEENENVFDILRQNVQVRQEKIVVGAVVIEQILLVLGAGHLANEIVLFGQELRLLVFGDRAERLNDDVLDVRLLVEDICREKEKDRWVSVELDEDRWYLRGRGRSSPRRDPVCSRR